MMESTMMKNVNTLQEMSSKNMKFIESSVKMAQAEVSEQRKHMVEMVKTVQERNAKMAQGSHKKHCGISQDKAT